MRDNDMVTGDKLLNDAYHNHLYVTGHQRIMVGLNFIHCPVCSKHAVLTPKGTELVDSQGVVLPPANF